MFRLLLGFVLPSRIIGGSSANCLHYVGQALTISLVRISEVSWLLVL